MVKNSKVDFHLKSQFYLMIAVFILIYVICVEFNHVLLIEIKCPLPQAKPNGSSAAGEGVQRVILGLGLGHGQRGAAIGTELHRHVVCGMVWKHDVLVGRIGRGGDGTGRGRGRVYEGCD